MTAGQQREREAPPPLSEPAWSEAPLWTELERVYRRVERGGDPDTRAPFVPRPDRPQPVPPAALPERWDPLAKLREIFGPKCLRNGHPAAVRGSRFGSAFQRGAGGGAAGSARAHVRFWPRPSWNSRTGARSAVCGHYGIGGSSKVEPGTLLQAPLSIDERILQYLLGVPAADERLELVLHAMPGSQESTEDRAAAIQTNAARGRCTGGDPPTAPSC